MPSKVLNPTAVLFVLLDEYVGWVDDEGVDGDGGGRATGVIVLGGGGVGDFSGVGGGGVRSVELLKNMMLKSLKYFLLYNEDKSLLLIPS